MTLGKGANHSESYKQKLNTKNSMEAKLVAIDNPMGRALWMRQVLAAQIHYVPPPYTRTILARSYWTRTGELQAASKLVT